MVSYSTQAYRSMTDSPTMQVLDDLNQLLAIFPERVRYPLETHPQRSKLVEVVLDIGRWPEARFANAVEYLDEAPVTRAELHYCTGRVGKFTGDNRAGIEQTLHRISAIRNRSGEVIGLTCRVGRAVFGTITLIQDLLGMGKSLLMLGRPGVGKTTALREIARTLADDLGKRVVIIDTSNEIAGDGDIPHPAIGRARRMQVAQPELQHQVMIEAVENHMPEVIVIDEIGTELEALAAHTIAERGVQLVGTAHGNHIENLIKNPTLADLIGGLQAVTLGDDEARRRGSQKTVLERKASPTFDIAVEMLERQRWVIHENVAETVDLLLRGRRPSPQVRTLGEGGKVLVTRELPTIADAPLSLSAIARKNWQTAGQMAPLPPMEPFQGRALSQQQHFGQLLESSWPTPAPTYPVARDRLAHGEKMVGLNGEELPLHVYPYAISRQLLDHVIQTLKLPVLLTKDLDSADAILALRSHVKHHGKLKRLAKTGQVPIHMVKSNSIPQIARALQQFLQVEENSLTADTAWDLLIRSGNDDEIEALEEARLAVEQVVIPKGQPVELLPRSSKVRKMQHELIEYYRLRSVSFGEEPNRRLRVYPT